MVVKYDRVKSVPNLELCRRLKELGLPQENGEWYWIKWKTIRDIETIDLVVSNEIDLDPYEKGIPYYFIEGRRGHGIRIIEYYKAPTVGEMMELLLKAGFRYKIYKNHYYCIQCYNSTQLLFQTEIQTIRTDTLSNAFAEMLIWLKENGYVNFDLGR